MLVGNSVCRTGDCSGHVQKRFANVSEQRSQQRFAFDEIAVFLAHLLEVDDPGVPFAPPWPPFTTRVVSPQHYRYEGGWRERKPLSRRGITYPRRTAAFPPPRDYPDAWSSGSACGGADGAGGLAADAGAGGAAGGVC